MKRGLKFYDADDEGYAPYDDYPMTTVGEREGIRYRGFLPTKTKLLVALPSLGAYFLKFLKTSFMKPFYTDDYPQASLSVIALFTVIAPLIGVVWSPLLAAWTDSCTSRAGRRRPFLVVAAVVGTVVATVSFFPPKVDPVGSGIWWGMCHIVFIVFWQSIHTIPYDALVSDLTPDFHERSNVYSCVEVFTVVGILFGATLPAFIIFGPDCSLSPCTGCYSYAVLALVGGLLLYTFPLAALVAKVRERRDREDDPVRVSIAQTMIETMCNRPFRYLVFSDVIEGVGGNLPMAVLPYIVKWVIGWKALEEAGLSTGLMFALLAGVHLVVRVPFTFVWSCVASRIGKVKAFILFNFVFAFQHMCFLSIGEGDIGLAIALAATWGMAYAGHWMLKDIMTSVVDYDEFRFGKRREGSYFMLLDYIPTVMEIPSEAVPFLLMCHFGYTATHSEGAVDCSLDSTIHSNVTHSIVERQSAGVVWTLRLSFSVVPALFGLLSTFVLLGFPIRTQGQHDEILAGIWRHKQGLPSEDPLTGRIIHPILHDDSGAKVIAGRALSEHTYNCLAHFFPRELRRVYAADDFKVLRCCLLVWIFMMVVVFGLGLWVLLAGFPELVDGECSMSPLGLCLMGAALVFMYLQGTRLLRLQELINDDVPMEDVAAMLTLHDPAIGGGRESESESDEAYGDVCAGSD
eukprot:TRINITY_DN13164_c0_g1_i1.p1 TRINITY_DN13164_c0_g1~~TRINITY_DN13164_c0_g1_i1.p1  ORF type:complete len:686 (-),score=72.41 TRINITY_DN13164_c0_g1_i1:166-2223(-)